MFYFGVLCLCLCVCADMKASSCYLKANNLTLNCTLTPTKVLCDMEGFIKEKQISRKVMYFSGKTERASIRNEVI